MCNPKKVAKKVGKGIKYVAKKVKNTVKDVSGVTAAENAAKKAQAEADRVAAARRKELEALGRARDATAAQQLAQMAQMEADQSRFISENQDMVSGLRSEQEAKLLGIRTRGRAVTGSLKILSQERKAGRTAAVNTKKARSKSAKTTQASLRIASQGASGRGAGTNISV